MLFGRGEESIDAVLIERRASRFALVAEDILVVDPSPASASGETALALTLEVERNRRTTLCGRIPPG